MTNTPASAKTAQAVAREAAQSVSKSLLLQRGTGEIEAIVLRAAREIVRGTGAREHLVAYRDEQAGFANQIISPRRLHDEYAERAKRIAGVIAALDQLEGGGESHCKSDDYAAMSQCPNMKSAGSTHDQDFYECKVCGQRYHTNDEDMK